MVCVISSCFDIILWINLTGIDISYRFLFLLFNFCTSQMLAWRAGGISCASAFVLVAKSWRRVAIVAPLLARSQIPPATQASQMLKAHNNKFELHTWRAKYVEKLPTNIWPSQYFISKVACHSPQLLRRKHTQPTR